MGPVPDATTFIKVIKIWRRIESAVSTALWEKLPTTYGSWAVEQIENVPRRKTSLREHSAKGDVNSSPADPFSFYKTYLQPFLHGNGILSARLSYGRLFIGLRDAGLVFDLGK
jgi:hypothetical protein